MKDILVIGSAGQIGSELTPELRKRYRNSQVVAGIHKTQPPKEWFESGPVERVDVTDKVQLSTVVRKYKIDTIYNLAALLSVVGEAIQLMEVDPSRLKHRNSFNIAAMSFCPEMIAAEIRRHIPDFEIRYKIDPVKQSIAESWPNKMDNPVRERSGIGIRNTTCR